MRPRLLLVSSLVAALVLAAGIARFLRRPPEVTVGEIRRESVARVLALTGRLRPHFVTEVKPRVSATLLDLLKRDGEAVAAGQLLARLDDRAQRAQVEGARAVLMGAQKGLAQSQRDLERARELASAGLLAASELEARRLDVERDRGAVRQAEESVHEAAAHLDDYLLRAPHDGFVLERPVDPGQMATPETLIYRLGTADAPWVEALVDEAYISEIHQGLEAEVAVPGGRGGPWGATVAFVGRQVDRQSGSATVRLAFTGRAPELPAGLSLDLNIHVADHRNVLTAPRSALLGFGSASAVLIAPRTASGAVERRAVEVIDWPAERVVVRAGLAEGEHVVLAPRGIAPGTVVRPRLELPPVH